MSAILRHEEMQDDSLPHWVKQSKKGKPLKLMMGSELENCDPDGRATTPQPLHIDRGLPTTLTSLEELRDAKIAITAGIEPVCVWVVADSHRKMLDLAAAHIRCERMGQ